MRPKEITPEELCYRIERWSREFFKDGLEEFIARLGELEEEDILGAFEEEIGNKARVFELLEELEREKRVVCEFVDKWYCVKPIWRIAK